MEGKPKKATFAAGCFWGVEKIFAKIPGVVSTAVGYTGGVTGNPTYEQVCAGRTGHAEAVEVTYDPSRVGYEELLITFWSWHDPTTQNRQGPDVGSQYRSAIFTHDAEQETLARRSKEILGKAGLFKGGIVTEILPAKEFHPAEEYHQEYLAKNPGGYCSHFLQFPGVREALVRGGMKISSKEFASRAVPAVTKFQPLVQWPIGLWPPSRPPRQCSFATDTPLICAQWM